MSLALAVAGSVPNIDSFINPQHEFGARSYPILNTRQNSTTVTAGRNNTVNLFVDGPNEDVEYAASIVEACGSRTVLAMHCTAPASIYVPELATYIRCGTEAVKATVTVEPSLFQLSSATATSTLGRAVQVTVAETCTLAGTTAATCAATVIGTVDKTSTSIARTTTISGSGYYRYDVEITGGAEKTVNAPATCTTPATAKSAAIAHNTKTMAVWALIGFAGVASMVAL